MHTQTHKSKPYYVHNFLAHNVLKKTVHCVYHYLQQILLGDSFPVCTDEVIKRIHGSDDTGIANNLRKMSQERDKVQFISNGFIQISTRKQVSLNVFVNKTIQIYHQLGC